MLAFILNDENAAIIKQADEVAVNKSSKFGAGRTCFPNEIANPVSDYSQNIDRSAHLNYSARWPDAVFSESSPGLPTRVMGRIHAKSPHSGFSTLDTS